MKNKIMFFSMLLLSIIFSLSVIFFQIIGHKDILPKTMTSEELNYFITEKNTGFIYIGRPTCPDCKKFEPVLKKYLKIFNVQIKYYNTSDAREKNEEKLNEILVNLKITSIPTVIFVENGMIRQKLDGNISNIELEEFIKKYH